MKTSRGTYSWTSVHVTVRVRVVHGLVDRDGLGFSVFDPNFDGCGLDAPTGRRADREKCPMRHGTHSHCVQLGKSRRRHRQERLRWVRSTRAIARRRAVDVMRSREAPGTPPAPANPSRAGRSRGGVLISTLSADRAPMGDFDPQCSFVVQPLGKSTIRAVVLLRWQLIRLPLWIFHALASFHFFLIV